MVEAGAKEVPEAQMVEALERAHAAIKEIVAGIDQLAAQAGKTKRAAAVKKEVSKDLVAEVEGKVLGPLSDAMRIKDKLENYATVDKVISEFVASLPDDDPARKAEVEVDREGAQRKDPARRDPRPRPAAGRPEVRRDPQDHDRSRRPPPHARLLPVHARRDPGARHGHARHGGRPAEGRDRRRRDVEALHAPLQLPAVLGRRSEVPARTRTARDRPRRARRALARRR